MYAVTAATHVFAARRFSFVDTAIITPCRYASIFASRLFRRISRYADTLLPILICCRRQILITIADTDYIFAATPLFAALIYRQPINTGMPAATADVLLPLRDAASACC